MILLFNKESLATKLIILFKRDNTIQRKQSLAIKKKSEWNITITSRNGSKEHQLPLLHFNMIILSNKKSLATEVIILFNMIILFIKIKLS